MGLGWQSIKGIKGLQYSSLLKLYVLYVEYMASLDCSSKSWAESHSGTCTCGGTCAGTCAGSWW